MTVQLKVLVIAMERGTMSDIKDNSLFHAGIEKPTCRRRLQAYTSGSRCRTYRRQTKIWLNLRTERSAVVDH
jgi:hypothetical protein